jgi:hypothetical protein
LSIQKIVLWIGVAIALVGAFVTIPYAAAALVVAGLIVGFTIAAEEHVRVIVSALALTALAATLSAIPAAGTYLSSFVGSLGVLAAGGAIMIILRNIYARLTL